MKKYYTEVELFMLSKFTTPILKSDLQEFENQLNELSDKKSQKATQLQESIKRLNEILSHRKS